MKKVTEAGGKLAPVDANTGRMEITLITPGWGSSGYYSAAMLEQAAADKVFPARTQQHIDHDTGVGTLNTLAAYLTEDARWDPKYQDPNADEPGRLVAEALIGSEYRAKLTEFADVIGASISASADIKLGEAAGRKGMIVEKLYPDVLNRVDFVTAAGRGGKIEAVLESLREATANDTREALAQAVKAAYEETDLWPYVLDYDDTNVWFEVAGKTYQHGYTLGEDAVASLDGDPVEVRRVTTYQPIAAPQEAATDSPPNPAGVTEEKEPVMATIQIEESVHAELVANSGRATALETEANAAKEALKEVNDEAAATIVAAALEAAGFTAPKLAARLAEGYAVKENGALDQEALKGAVAESIAELQAAGGAGTPRGVGRTEPVVESTAPAHTVKDAVAVLEGKK